MAQLYEITAARQARVFAGGVKMIVSNKERMGVKWEGSEGWVSADRGRHDASTKAILGLPNKIPSRAKNALAWPPIRQS